MKVALMQLMPCASLEGNLRKGLTACRDAKRMGADIALFPEMWSNGYHVADSLAALRAEAIPARGDFTSAFAALAAELDMAIGVTLLEEHDPSPRNTLLLFDRHGKEALSYAKVHTCDFEAEKYLTPGEDFPVTALDTAEGPVQVGAMICYDREFPESARILMLKGAEIILTPNACPMEINRLEQLRSRAFENMLGVATCNYPEGQPDCNGRSSAFDGVAWLPELADSRDMCLCKAGGAEGIYLASFDLALMRAYRAREIHGNAYRHPDKYRLLTEKAIRAPFVRADYRP